MRQHSTLTFGIAIPRISEMSAFRAKRTARRIHVDDEDDAEGSKQADPLTASATLDSERQCEFFARFLTYALILILAANMR